MVLVKAAKSYYRMESYNAASISLFKGGSELSTAPVLGESLMDCENTHDEVLLSYLEDNTRDLYYRFDVPQGMQQVILDEWAKMTT